MLLMKMSDRAARGEDLQEVFVPPALESLVRRRWSDAGASRRL